MKHIGIFSPKVLWTALLLLAAGMLQAQETGTFEGTVAYDIRVSGKAAPQYLANEPPNKLTMHLRQDDFIVKLMGGRIPRTFLFIADSNHTYIVDFPNRRYFERTYFVDTTGYVPVAQPTGETRKVGKHVCQEYKVVRQDRKEIDLFYVNDQFRVDTTLFAELDGAKADFLVPGLGGRIPLMKVIKTPELTTELNLSYIKAEEFPEEAFRIPEGFSNKRKRDPRK